ncbi:MAG: MFS transporter [Actinomycetota bacterium]
MGSGRPGAGPRAGIDDKWLAFAAVGSFFVIAVLGLTMVFVALPAMADDFGVTLKAASWIVIAPSLTISALLLPFGRLADLVGRRRVHLAGLALFAVGAAMTALSTSFAMLLVSRVVMSIGGALAESVGTGILVSVFPAAERGKAIGSQTSAVAVGAAAGPLAAGIALEFLSWRALFWLLVWLTAISFAIGVRVLDEERITPVERERQPFDLTGASLSLVLVVAFVLTVNNPIGLAWSSAPMVAAIVLVVATLAAFVWWELRSPHPMLELRFFADPTFARGIVARTLGFVVNAAVYILVPILLVSVVGVSESRAGIAVFLNSVGLGVAAQIAGRLSDRWGAKRFIVFGFAASIVIMSVFAWLDQGSPLWLVAAVALAAGLSTGLWNVPNNAAIIGTVPPASYGVVGAFTNLARNVGNVFGQAAVAAIVAGTMAARGFDIPLGDIADTPGAAEAFVDGWRLAFLVMAALGVLSTVAALLMSPPPGRAQEVAPARS